MWAFINGSEVSNTNSSFGPLREPHPDAYPGGRSNPVCWKDSNGYFWLYGGYGYITSDTYSKLAELWRFDGTYWGFWGGSTIKDAPPFYIGQKNFSFYHHPGGRNFAGVAVTPSGSVYLIGGDHKSGFTYSISDIWKFENDKGWAYLGGETTNKYSIPGTMKVPNETNKLGGIIGAYTVVDEYDNIWIFGGYGNTANFSLGMFQTSTDSNRCHECIMGL